MSAIVKVVTSVPEAVLRDLLHHHALSTPEIELIAEADHPIELLLTVQEHQPDVVIMSAVATDDPPPICTHLLTEFPDLLVISVCPKTHRAATYRNTIETDTLPGASLRDVITTIRSLSWHV